ncbi:MAG: hypothetical protein ACT4OQ_12725 [Chloroflexota bacterium]
MIGHASPDGRFARDLLDMWSTHAHEGRADAPVMLTGDRYIGHVQRSFGVTLEMPDGSSIGR